MISIRQQPADPAPAPAQREVFARRITLTYASTLLLMALIAVAGYLTHVYADDVARSSANAIALTEQQAMLAQRVASFAGQLALGNTSVRRELTAGIERFERTHTLLVGGDNARGFGSAISDPALKGLYFGGGTPLDALATEFTARARRIAKMSPDNALIGAQTAPLFLIAQGPLPAEFDAAIRVRQDSAAARLDLLRALQLGLTGALLVTLLVSGLAVFRPMARRIVALMREAESLAETATVDPVTGMLNRRSFHARGAIEVQKARRYGRPLSVLLIDADQLPSIEDTYGPDGGLTVLKALTSSVFAGTRVCDLVARVDAEQFAILLPETNRDGAVLLAERLRQKISDLSVPIDDTLVSCTVSIGVAAAEKDATFLWPTFKRADEALYEAKMRGRNRVVAAAA